MVIVIHLRAVAYYVRGDSNVLNSYLSLHLVLGPIVFFTLQRKHSLLCPENDLKKKGR